MTFKPAEPGQPQKTVPQVFSLEQHEDRKMRTNPARPSGARTGVPKSRSSVHPLVAGATIRTGTGDKGAGGALDCFRFGPCGTKAGDGSPGLVSSCATSRTLLAARPTLPLPGNEMLQFGVNVLAVLRKLIGDVDQLARDDPADAGSHTSATTTVARTETTRPVYRFWRSAATGVSRKVRMRANANGIRISRAKYSAAMVPNRTMAPASLRSPGRELGPAGGMSCFIGLGRCSI